MSLRSRELSVTYGTYTVGGDQTARVLDGVHIVEDSFTQATVRLTFTIKEATEAAFASAVAEAENAFRKVRQDCVIRQGAQTLKSFSHSLSTGFNSEAVIEKSGGPKDTGRSRQYVVRITVGRPADNMGTNGRRSSSVNVTYTPARVRTAIISGSYTAIDTTDARTQYGTYIDLFAASVLAGLGGTWKLAEEPRQEGDENDAAESKVLEFTRVYEEIIYTGVGGSDADVRRETVNISRNKIGPGDTPTANRLVTVTGVYSAWINKESTTNLEGKWATLRTSLLGQIQSTLGSGSMALVDENVDFDYTANRISATLVCVGPSTGGLIENRVTTEYHTEHGLVLVPAWLAGRPLARYIYQGPRTIRKIITIQQRALGGGGGGPGGGGSPPGQGAAPGGVQFVGIGAGGLGGLENSLNVFGFNVPLFGGGPVTGAQITALVNAVMGNQDQGGGGGGAQAGAMGWIPISISNSTTPLRLGIGDRTIDVEDSTIITVFEQAEPISGGGGATPNNDVATVHGGGGAQAGQGAAP